MYRPYNDANIDVRAEPLVSGGRTDVEFEPGQEFGVSEELPGDGFVTYLRLSDGRGWLFDRLPGKIMCVLAEEGCNQTKSMAFPVSLPPEETPEFGTFFGMPVAPK